MSTLPKTTVWRPDPIATGLDTFQLKVDRSFEWVPIIDAAVVNGNEIEFFYRSGRSAYNSDQWDTKIKFAELKGERFLYITHTNISTSERKEKEKVTLLGTGGGGQNTAPKQPLGLVHAGSFIRSKGKGRHVLVPWHKRLGPMN